MAKYLITHGADINARDINGDTALHIATRTGNRAMIFILLANGTAPDNRANPSIANYDGQSAVDIAANTPEILKIFTLAAVPNKEKGTCVSFFLNLIRWKKETQEQPR